MKEETTKHERSIMAPFLVGGLLGAGIALILAPKSGKEMREDLKTIAGNTRDKITTTVDRSKELYAEGVTAVRSAVGTGKEAFVREVEKHRKAA